MRRTIITAGACLAALAQPYGVLGQGTTAPAATAPQQATAQAKTFKQEELDQLLAPIALYPDALIAQILMASTYPLEIVEAARWIKANPNVKDKALQDAMEKQTWDPSVKSLTTLPQVLQMMNEKLDWTQKLGDAFLAQQKDVMATVQSLRAKADATGNLKSTEQQTVKTEKEGTQTTYIIEPAQPEVIYVPTYNPTVVYGSWPYPSYPPYYYYPPGYVAGAGFAFATGVVVGAAIWGNCNWGGGNVNVNVNRYNNFNRTNVNNSNWQHNVEHRKGVSYRDQNVAQQYNRGGNAQNVKAREDFRGRADAGRAEQGGDRGQRESRDQQGDRGQSDRAGQTRDSGAGDRGQSDRAGETRDVGAADRGPSGAGGGQSRDFGSRSASSGLSSGGFQGAGNGGATRQASARGGMSRGGGGRGGGRR